MTPLRRLLFLVIGVAVLGVFWLLWHTLVRPTRPGTSTPAALTDTAQESLARNSGEPTELYAHNLRLRKGPQFRVYIAWIRGQMVRTRRQVAPSFDDPDSFVLEIQKGVIHANIGDVGNFLTTNAPADAPLKNISIQPVGEQLKLRGTVHKIVPLPVELVGELSPTPTGQVRFHVLKLDVLKIPLKGLLGGFNVKLDDLVHSSNIPGVQVEGNDIIFDTEKLLPPPHIRGLITSVKVRPPDLEVIYGDAGNNEERLSEWHNFLKLTGGTLDFGKLSMHPVDLTMIDASSDPWFDLDLVNYQAQLVNGYTRMTPTAGLEIFMPDFEEQSQKKSTPAITMDWLKDRKQKLPAEIMSK